VTNDKFRDYLQKLELNPATNDSEAVKRDRAWIKQHCISFAFKGDQFLPNPDSKLFTRFPFETYKQVDYPKSDE
jgi:hypothetical protein